MQIRYRLAFDGVCRLSFGVWSVEEGMWCMCIWRWQDGRAKARLFFYRGNRGGTKKSYYHFHVAGAELGT